MIPIYMDISGYKVLVLGGGYEATKKVGRLIRHGADITVYSLDFSDRLIELADKGIIRIIKGDVRDFDVVSQLILQCDLIVYTVPGYRDVESWVVNMCKKYRKIHIISTNAEITQAALPVEMTLYGLRITVFSGGKSTLVAMKTLDLIKECLRGRNDIEILLEAMYFLKVYMKSKQIPYKSRMRIYREIFRDKRLLQYVERGDLEGAKKYVRNYVDSTR